VWIHSLQKRRDLLFHVDLEHFGLLIISVDWILFDDKGEREAEIMQ